MLRYSTDELPNLIIQVYRKVELGIGTEELPAFGT